MTKNVKQKLCWNCEGSVARTIDNCPFCGVYLNPEESASEDFNAEELKAPYTPSEALEKDVPQAPYQPMPQAQEALFRSTAIEAQYSPLFKEIVAPLLLLTSGAIAALFAILLLLFSVNGKLILEWDAGLWYFYALAAIPLLLAGWKSLNPLNK